ncbi:MAG TPA: sugar metabolism transcriptional regulator [Bryobacterales bacterium]|nr:sugar metabolism transcriptional regulator [Bryobacterales bacterium]
MHRRRWQREDEAMLHRILEYLKTRDAACLSEIAAHLEADPDAVRPMLRLLEARGRIRRLSAARPEGCGGCTACLPESLSLWEAVREA